MRIGLVGAGNMAAAMARGWSAAAAEGAEGAPEAIAICDSGSGRAAKLAAELGTIVAADAAEAAAEADVVVLATKPGGLDEAAPALAAAGKPVVSVLGATTIETLENVLGEAPVVRVMPNVAVELRRGVLAYAYASRVGDDLRGQVDGLLGTLGTAIELDEALIDPATAIMGCSPAYIALVAEALVDAGVREGIPEAVALRMVTATLDGTAGLLGDRDSLEVRRSVTSPGGSTAAGLEALERGALRAAFSEAVAASLARMRG